MDKMIIMSAICDRAKEMGIASESKFNHMMDLGLADKAFNMDWEGLLNADPFNFSHDFCGINNNINREAYNRDYQTIDFNLFVPRYAR